MNKRKSRSSSSHGYVSSNFSLGTSLVGSNQDDSVVTWVGRFPCFVSDELVIEILSKLPVKSLMRFKSVCKHWSSLIKHDRHCIDLHFNNCLKLRPNLLCMSGINQWQKQVYNDVQQEDDDTEEEEDNEQQEVGLGCTKLKILFADIVEGSSGIGEEIVSRAILTEDKWFDYETVLGVVNGLACFLDWDEDNVKIYNVSTREASPWIKTTLLSEEIDKFERKDTSISREAIYRFGFDPEKKEHKVFCFCRLTDRCKPSRIAECPDYTNCEVLAVGRETKWRRSNVVPNENNQIKIMKVFPSLEMKTDPVYAHGTIYWGNKFKSCKKGVDVEYGYTYSDDPDFIVALDVGSEKFRVIPIPKFILDEHHVYHKHTALFMLWGRVAVAYWLSNDIVKLWMLDDGVDKKLENCQGSERNWISETIKLPYDYCPIRQVELHGVADQLVLFIYTEDRAHYRKFGYFHIYDRNKKVFNEIKIDGLSSVPFFVGTSLITTFTGSLYPVQPQQD